jgi:UPF0716 family protein affecting phage T7 exclusion
VASRKLQLQRPRLLQKLPGRTANRRLQQQLQTAAAPAQIKRPPQALQPQQLAVAWLCRVKQPGLVTSLLLLQVLAPLTQKGSQLLLVRTQRIAQQQQQMHSQQ